MPSIVLLPMIVLTHSDVRVYCLGIAQLIPVLLIALFVADSGSVTRLTEKLLRESSDLEKENRKTLEKVQRQSEERIAKLKTEIAALDMIDPSQISKEALSALETSRAELAAGLEDESAELSRISKDLSEIARASELRKATDAELSKLMKYPAYYLIFGIFLGLVGEAIVLLGAVGLINGLAAVTAGTNSTLLVIGVLAYFAVQRLIVESPSPSWLVEIQYYLTAAVFLVAGGSTLWILISVKVVNY